MTSEEPLLDPRCCAVCFQRRFLTLNKSPNNQNHSSEVANSQQDGGGLLYGNNQTKQKVTVNGCSFTSCRQSRLCR